jgi:hypothetical protein
MSFVQEDTRTEIGLSAPVSKTEVANQDPFRPENDAACSISLRCFAYKAGTRLYRAECIDLDIGTESESLEGAVHELNDAILGYLAVVLEGVKTNQQVPTAILRPSPLSHRLHYRFACLIHRAFALVFPVRDRSTKRFYRIPYGLNATHCHV